MVAAMNTEGKTTFVFHSAVAFLVPLTLQLALMHYNPYADEELDSSELGHEDSLVFVRQIFLSTILCVVYIIRLRTIKTTFIRRCLHEMNEKSINDVLDEVSEPIIIVKRKHKMSLKPKYMNKAAKDILYND